jgi:hypothetical protein
MIRALRVARRGAMKARVQAGAQLDSLVVAAPESVRAGLRKLTTKQRVRVCAAFRPGRLDDPVAAAKTALRALARRWQALQAEIDDLDAHLTTLVSAVAPQLIALPGVGVDTAGQLLVTAGDNPDRLRSEAAFARLCGVAPIPVSSGRTDRHRLHRGGDRLANSALWRIALVRMHCHQPTKDYVTRRTTEGKTKPEILRCLKRYIARETYPLLTGEPSRQQPIDDRGRAIRRELKVLAAEHGAAEHLAEDGSLVFGQRIDEYHRPDVSRPTRVGDFAGLTCAQQCPPRERSGHLVHAAVRDTPALHVPAHNPGTVRLHRSRQQIQLGVQLGVLRREQADE